jgi:hypothetical protein
MLRHDVKFCLPGLSPGHLICCLKAHGNRLPRVVRLRLFFVCFTVSLFTHPPSYKLSKEWRQIKPTTSNHFSWNSIVAILTNMLPRMNCGHAREPILVAASTICLCSSNIGITMALELSDQWWLPPVLGPPDESSVNPLHKIFQITREIKKIKKMRHSPKVWSDVRNSSGVNGVFGCLLAGFSMLGVWFNPSF